MVGEADLLKTSRSRGGVTNVETITITITTVKTLFVMIPLVMPALATIKPTSPREIIPTPTRNDSPHAMPPAFAPNPQPTILEMMAIMITTIAKARSLGDKARMLAVSPIPTKKIGTKKE